MVSGPDCGPREETIAGVLSVIRILTVDDHPLLRQGIAALVNSEDDMELVAEAANGEEAVESYRLYRPDVTLMDLQLPRLNGLEATSRILTEFPKARIIVFTTHGGDAQVVRALRAGARAFMLKVHVPLELLETIRTVHAGGKRIPPDIATELAQHATDDELSSREIEVLRLIATGNSNKQIGDRLSIGEGTVKTHVTNILSKLDANDRTHAVTLGLKRGIIAL
jgi:DNA-binding NarL/FixJ family response regulator